MAFFLIGLACALSLQCGSYRKALQDYDDSIPDNEIRALWVVRSELKSRESIHSVIDAMRRNGLNVAIVQVRGRGDSFYNSRLVSRASGLEDNLDPLAEFIQQARPAGIQVHAWVNVFLAADATTFLENQPGHLINERKDWFLKDGENRSMLDYSQKDYRLANVEGAFLDPANPEVRAYNLEVIQEILDNYDVDGLHLDYIRYPWSRPGTVYDFGARTALHFSGQKDLYSDVAGKEAEESRRRQVDELRRQNVTTMVMQIHDLMKTRYPERILSAAVWPSQSKIRNHIFQDFPRWLKEDWIDLAYLMAYYNQIDLHDSRMEEFFDPAINEKLVIGIGVFRSPSPAITRHQLRSARAIAAAGVCYFDASWFLDQAREDEIAQHRLLELFSGGIDEPPMR